MYDNSAIEPYRTIGAWVNSKMSERNPSLYCLYSYIDRRAGTPNKTKTKDAIILDYSSICYIASRMVVAGVHRNFVWCCGIGKPTTTMSPTLNR